MCNYGVQSKTKISRQERRDYGMSCIALFWYAKEFGPRVLYFAEAQVDGETNLRYTVHAVLVHTVLYNEMEINNPENPPDPVYSIAEAISGYFPLTL